MSNKEKQHYAKITISEKESKFIKETLRKIPTTEEECFGEDEKVSHTAIFDDGKQMDVQMCGVQFNEEEYSGNRPWTQAVLYDETGHELTFSEAEDTYDGLWELEYDDEVYCVYVQFIEKVYPTKEHLKSGKITGASHTRTI